MAKSMLSKVVMCNMYNLKKISYINNDNTDNGKRFWAQEGAWERQKGVSTDSLASRVNPDTQTHGQTLTPLKEEMECSDSVCCHRNKCCQGK